MGSAISISMRWRAHKHFLRHKKKAPPKLQQAWDKYGEEVFVFEVLEFCEKDKALEREQHWIDTLKPKYNTRPTAHSNLGVKWSKEVNRAKGRPVHIYTVRGLTGSLREIVEHFQVATYACAKHRMRRYGWDVEKAVLTEMLDHKERGKRAAATHKSNGTHPGQRYETVNGVTGSLKQLTEKFAVVSYGTVCMRIRRGMSVKDAILTPLIPTNERAYKRKAE